MIKFIIIEVGSTTTKAYLYENEEIKSISRITIPFKANYKLKSSLQKEDKEKLYKYVNENKMYFTYVYGTSIFRTISTKERNEFEDEFKQRTNLEFNTITQEIENKYTTYGATRNINYNNNVAVMIGGGASTELSIVKNKKIIETSYYDFGAVDITNKFNDLKENKATTDYETMINYIKEKLKETKNKPEVLILAGGDYLYFYEQLQEKLQTNTLFNNKNEPYMLDINEMEKIDKKFIYETSLNNIKEKTNDPLWWDGARAMRLIVEALAKTLGVKYIIPTKITCVYGVVEELKIIL